MAPPAHTDPEKWSAMKSLADKYLSDEAIDNTGLLDKANVRKIFVLHEADDTPVATQVKLDAVINHLLGIQILHKHFVQTDVPKQAEKRAAELGWLAQ